MGRKKVGVVGNGRLGFPKEHLVGGENLEENPTEQSEGIRNRGDFPNPQDHAQQRGTNQSAMPSKKNQKKALILVSVA